jgi:uncharacterized protein HemX
MSAADLFALINKGGATAVLIVVVLALAAAVRWLFSQLQSAHEEALQSMREERDAWKTIALTGQQIAGRSVELVERAAPQRRPRR